jgi:hypothetical protein
VKIRERLTRWLFVEYDQWKMIWVRGSAGTGKSAIAQSFGDACGEEKRHGASYFFSRTAGRNKLETVVPTLVCQLATTIPEYRSIIGHQLANNPFLLRQSLPVQFREFIVEPFATLQRQRPRKPIVIILDGLDECEGEDAQRRILEVVTNAIHSHPDLPLRWLIFSRPEAHLKNSFSKNSLCGREELIIDAECHGDVERYVRARLVEIQSRYDDVTPGDWPSPDSLQELLDAVSGLFVFASTCLNFIDDPDKANPPSQLDSLLAFLRRSQAIVSRNPLAVLDLLYSQILEKIPPEVYKTTKQILTYMSHRNQVDSKQCLDSAQALSNFLRLDRQMFYVAARGLHSVTSIPDPDDADKSQLRFYHASFQDFLINPNRSGKFCISEQDAVAVIVPLCVHWYEVDTTLFHTHDGKLNLKEVFSENGHLQLSGWKYDYAHDHGPFHDLSWASGDNRLRFSQSITSFFPHCMRRRVLSQQWDCVDQDFLSRLSNIDFRRWPAPYLCFVAMFCRLVSLLPISFFFS